jgi:hypothetical protein
MRMSNNQLFSFSACCNGGKEVAKIKEIYFARMHTQYACIEKIVRYMYMYACSKEEVCIYFVKTWDGFVYNC